MTKGTVHQEDITALHVHAPDNGALKLRKGQLTNPHSLFTAGDYNPCFSEIDRISGQEISSKNIEALKSVNLTYLIFIE